MPLLRGFFCAINENVMADEKCKNCGFPVVPQIVIGGEPGPQGPKGDKGDPGATPDMAAYLPRRDKQTFDADVNTLWAVGSSVVLSRVNTPRTDTYYLVATFGTNSSDSAQIAVPRSGGPAYYRGFNANNNTWTSWEQIRRINDKVTTSDIADAAITAPKLSSDLTLPALLKSARRPGLTEHRKPLPPSATSTPPWMPCR